MESFARFEWIHVGDKLFMFSTLFIIDTIPAAMKRYVLVSEDSRLRWFRCYFLIFAFGAGLVAVAAVSHRRFLSFAFSVRSSIVRRFPIFRYSGVSYCDCSPPSPVCILLGRGSGRRTRILRRLLTALKKRPAYTRVESGRSARCYTNHRSDGPELIPP